MKRLYFFATKNDVLSATDSVEAKGELKYILAHHNLHPKYREAPLYETARSIPDLGKAAASQTGNCERYLIVDRSTVVVPMTRLIESKLPGGGKPITSFEAGNCSQCVEFNAGGFWDRVLINGLVQTWSDSAEAQKLMRSFAASFRKDFKTKIGQYLVGPEALEYLRDGGRLTLNVSAAPSFDLKLPD